MLFRKNDTNWIKELENLLTFVKFTFIILFLSFVSIVIAKFLGL